MISLLEKPMERIILGNAIEVLKELPAESIDCCVTSPPYYQLRDYGITGQIGLEQTVEEYISKLVEVFSEVKRVLKPDGTLWVNIADSYSGSNKGSSNYPDNAKKYKQGTNKGMLGAKLKAVKSSKPKDLLGVPWLLALALRNDGWYLRQDIIWEKPNCMPESVKDRCTKAHEYIFLLSKSKKYYFDWEAIQEPCVGFDKSAPRGSKTWGHPNSGRRKGNRKTFRGGGAYTNNASFDNSTDKQNETSGNVPNDKGLRRKRSVWSVATKGIKEAHFATFPKKIVEPCVLAGSRKGGTVLDPFAGSGTVGLVAKENERGFVLIELSPEYSKIIKKRIYNQGEN